MAVAIGRGVQPLQQRTHALWQYNGSNDATRVIRKGFESLAALAAALEAIYKGGKEDFANQQMFDGFFLLQTRRSGKLLYPIARLIRAGFLYF